MPLAPIPMLPAYRSGDATPWGGDTLRTLFQRSIPDDRTGESLEVSAIDGLNSRDPDGNTLSQLIARYGARLTGSGHTGAFPLLLKLISARDRLSVQVHPDDAYAAQHEGKLGKTEAWIILAAQDNAQLVYGLKEHTTKEQLLSASLQGAAVEGLLRFVPVKAGDAFFIPAGTVHAIGEGITLYEIQQSSDVTYRFYDWERRNEQGEKRELHLQKAIDVTDVDKRMDAVRPQSLPLVGQGQREELLRCPFFVVERYLHCLEAQLPPDTNRFAMLTAIAPADITWETGRLHLQAGETALLPADGYTLSLTGEHLLYAAP